MLTIGQFVDTYPPCVDGVGRVTMAYCDTLTDMGHTCWYIAPNAPDPQREVYRFPVLLQKSMRIPGEPFRLAMPQTDVSYRRQLGKIPFDVVHAQSPFSAGEEALRVARKRGIPLVTTFHSKYYQDFYDKTHSRVIARGVVDAIIRFYNKCDGVWTVNHATAEVLREYGYKGRVLIMENGTNPADLSPAAQTALNRRVQLDDRPVLLFVGQHNYKKNLHGILDACALLHAEGQPFQLVTAGDGPDFDAIRTEAESKGLGQQLHMLGFMSDRDELMALYHRADLLVFPSIYDNAPMVLREAAAMGTPAVVVRGSCSSEGVVDGENGFICADESGQAIADAVRRALPDCQRVGEGARASIPVAWKDILPKALAEYESLIQEKNS